MVSPCFRSSSCWLCNIFADCRNKKPQIRNEGCSSRHVSSEQIIIELHPSGSWKSLVLALLYCVLSAQRCSKGHKSIWSIQFVMQKHLNRALFHDCRCMGSITWEAILMLWNQSHGLCPTIWSTICNESTKSTGNWRVINAAKKLVFDLIVFHTLHVKKETFVCGSQNFYILAVWIVDLANPYVQYQRPRSF